MYYVRLIYITHMDDMDVDALDGSV